MDYGWDDGQQQSQQQHQSWFQAGGSASADSPASSTNSLFFDTEDGYGLFSAGNQEADDGATSMLGMDFWSNTGSSLAAGQGSSSSAANNGGDDGSRTFVKKEPIEDEMMLLQQARLKESTLHSSLAAGLSPETMDFEELLKTANANASLPNSPVAGKPFSRESSASTGLFSPTSMDRQQALHHPSPQAIDTSALFGNATAQLSNSFASTSALPDLLGAQSLANPYGSSTNDLFPFNPSQQVPTYPQQQQHTYASSNSDPASSSSRDSSAAPAERSFGDQRSAAQYDRQPSSSKTPSSTSTTRVHTAKNSPPQQSTSKLPTQSISGGSSSIQPDKHTQQTACESSQSIKTVNRSRQGAPCQLVVLGLPEEGARSRVETQVKIGLALLRARQGTGYTSTREESPDSLPPGMPRAAAYKDEKGAMMPEAAEVFEKVGAWKYICLPAVSSVKRKAKKHYKSGLPRDQTLFADIKVVSATTPSKEIFICSNCQQREQKRLQRKTANRAKPSGDIDSGREDEEALSEGELARRKVILFNCGQYLEFHNGEVIMPTRITCYCRHHKERYGFSIIFTLHDHLGNLVANAASPAIFLTDDHKAKPTKPEGIDLKHLPTSLARIANGPGLDSQRSSAWNSNASSLASSAASSVPSSAASSRGPSRSGSFESLDELAKSSQSSKARSSTRTTNAKPYNADARPGKPKRNNSFNRLNNFAMTPLMSPQSLSAPGSPRLPPSTGLPPVAGGLTQQQASQSISDLLHQPPSMVQTAPPASMFSLGESPSSSNSQPSTPAASLDSYTSGFFNNGQATSVTSDGDVASSVGSRSVEQSPAFHTYMPLPGSAQPVSLAQGLAALNMSQEQAAAQQMMLPQPKISRLIPNEGPMHGGVEIIILGENFSNGLEVSFGESPAVTSQLWGSGTLMCMLPPSPSPGPVVVGFKGYPMGMDSNAHLQLFTYLDTSDRALMELALQVVGMNMTGRLDNARDVARRIIGTNGTMHGAGQQPQQQQPFVQQDQQTPSGTNTLHKTSSSVALQQQLLSMDGGMGETKDFQAIVMKLLSLLDVDTDGLDGVEQVSAASIDHANEQKHTLLHLAALLGFHRLVSFLLSRNASLDLQDKHGYTPLHLAALSGRVTVTRLLLEARAATTVRNEAGQTAFDVARQRDQPDVEMLFSRSKYPSGVSLRSLVRLRRSKRSSRCPTPDKAHASGRAGRRARAAVFAFFDDESESGSDIERSIDRSRHSTSDREEYNDSSESWSGSDDDEGHWASESDLAERFSRHASAVSLASRTLSTPKGRKGRLTSTPSDESDDLEAAEQSSWLQRSLKRVSSFRLPTPYRLASWRTSAPTPPRSPKRAPLSQPIESVHSDSTSASSVSSPPTDREDAEAHVWPSSLWGRPVESSLSEEKAVGVDARKVVKASIARRLGYSIDNLTEDAMRSYSYHSQRYDTLRSDKMLYLFWLPLFFAALVWIALQASSVVSSAMQEVQRVLHIALPAVAGAHLQSA